MSIFSAEKYEQFLKSKGTSSVIMKRNCVPRPGSSKKMGKFVISPNERPSATAIEILGTTNWAGRKYKIKFDRPLA